MGISKFSNEPIYLKVYNNFKSQIMNGILKPNDKMPSVREVAVSLAVNPNTVQRAFSELERDGFIYAVMGKGNFVVDQISDAKNKVYNELLDEIKIKINKLIDLGYDKKTIIKEIEKTGGKTND